MVTLMPDRGSLLDHALSFTVLVHDEQKRKALWLAEQPFVRAVQAGSASAEDLARWVRLIYCTTRTYGEILRTMWPPPPVGVWTDPWRDLDQLVALAGALPGGALDTDWPTANPTARAVQFWLRRNLGNRSQHIVAQACWALVEAMSPEAGACLAEGAALHAGLKRKSLTYFRIGMGSRRSADRYAANLLTEIPTLEWPSVQAQALTVSRLMVQLYESVRWEPTLMSHGLVLSAIRA
jgi:hypothetical protein